MHDIAEATKVDCAITPQEGATSANGEYFNMKEYAKALFIAQVSGMLTGEDLTFEAYQAKDAKGTTPLQLGASGVGATITMAQGIKLCSCQITMNTPDADDTIIITPYTFVNGVLTPGTALTFTAKTAESLPNRYFDQSGSTTAQATSLAACINDPTYGVPGVLATAAAAVVTLTMTEPGDGVFDITELDTTKTVVKDLIQQAYFEVAVQDLTRDSDYTHIQGRFASVPATTATQCTLIRAVAGYLPVGQAVAYSDDAS